MHCFYCTFSIHFRWARAWRGYGLVISLHLIHAFQLGTGRAWIRCSELTAPDPFIFAGRGLGAVWAWAGRGSGGDKVLSFHCIALGAAWARAWRGFGAGLVGVSEGRPENKTKLGFLPL